MLILLALPDDLLKEAVPGNIRRAEHFVAFLKRFVEYLKVNLHIVASTRPQTDSVFADTYESSPCNIRDASVVPTASERSDLY